MTTPTAATPSEPVTPEPSAAQPPPGPPSYPPIKREGWSAGRVISVVLGSILGLIALGLLLAGGIFTWATSTQRDSTGFITSDRHRIVTPTSALTSDEVDFANWDGVVVSPEDVFGDVRIRASAIAPGTAVFIGVASKSNVDRYLAGVSHEVVNNWAPLDLDLRAAAGRAPITPPADADIWTEQASGTGTQTLTWRPDEGNWVAVVMNADGRPGVAVTADAGAEVPNLKWLAVGFLVGGGLVLIGALALTIVPIRRAHRVVNT